jgi:creatinine amidohydrolase/Fe(II)-dependent formamide hydrolase-like protein
LAQFQYFTLAVAVAVETLAKLVELVVSAVVQMGFHLQVALVAHLQPILAVVAVALLPTALAVLAVLVS